MQCVGWEVNSNRKLGCVRRKALLRAKRCFFDCFSLLTSWRQSGENRHIQPLLSFGGKDTVSDNWVFNQDSSVMGLLLVGGKGHVSYPGSIQEQDDKTRLLTSLPSMFETYGGAGKYLKKRCDKEKRMEDDQKDIKKKRKQKMFFWQQWQQAVFFCLSCLVSQNVYRLTLFNREICTTYGRRWAGAPNLVPQPITCRR